LYHNSTSKQDQPDNSELARNLQSLHSDKPVKNKFPSSNQKAKKSKTI